MATSPSPLRQALLEPLHLLVLTLTVVLGIVARVPPSMWTIIFALEFLYLTAFAHSAAYRRRVLVKTTQRSLDARETAFAAKALELRREDRRRYQAIDQLYVQLEKKLATESFDASLVNRPELEDLRKSALTLCLSAQRFREQLTKNNLATLRQQLAGLTDSREKGSSEVQATRNQQRELLEMRIEQLTHMEAQLPLIESKLEVIEQTFRLLLDQSHIDLSGSISQQITDVAHDVEAMRRTVAEMHALEIPDRR